MINTKSLYKEDTEEYIDLGLNLCNIKKDTKISLNFVMSIRNYNNYNVYFAEEYGKS